MLFILINRFAAGCSKIAAKLRMAAVSRSLNRAPQSGFKLGTIAATELELDPIL